MNGIVALSPMFQAYSYALFAAAVLFLAAGIRGSLDFRLSRSPIGLSFVGMALSMFVYAFCGWSALQRKGIPFSLHPLHLMWLTGLLANACYFRILRRYLGDKGRFSRMLTLGLAGLAAIVAMGELGVIGAGASFLFVPETWTSYNTLQRVAGADLAMPTAPMMAIGALSMVAIASGLFHFGRLAWKRSPREPWLLIGMSITAVAVVIEILNTTGAIDFLSFMFLSKGLELARIGHTLHRDALKRIRRLEQELSEVAQQAATAFVTGGLMHDLKNPLTVLQLQTQMIGKSLAREDASGFGELVSRFELVTRNIQRITGMTKGYLELVSQNQASAVSPCRVEEIIRGAVELSGPAIQRSGLSSVELQLSPGLSVTANRTQLELILANLLNNAIEAVAGQGTPWVRVVAEESSEGLRIRVLNSGSIPGEVRARLFEAGFTTKGPRGHGIGLRIASTLAEANGARLSCEEDSEGTCFQVLFPRGATA